MAKYLKLFLIIWGVALVGIGLGHVLFGVDSVLGAGTVNATIDSEDRFAGTLVVGYGIANIWAVRQSPIPVTLLRFLAAITVLGAVGRVLSMVERGFPHWFYTFGTVVEFVIVAVTLMLAAIAEKERGKVATSV